MKTAFLSFFALACGVNAATRVAVVEFGPGKSVHRTTEPSAETSVAGVLSFWSALHQNRRKLQHAGMTLVPDLFKKADSGIIIGISGNGVDLDTMPYLSSLLSEEGQDVIGHMEVAGARLESLMVGLPDREEVEATSLAESAKKHAEKPGLSGLTTVVDSASASTVDQQMANVLSGLKALAEQTGKNIVVHLVVEEEVASSRRRLLARRLEDNADAQDGNAADNGGENQQQYNAYYGYGYYNDYGEWVTPYKTMFQIQYFNIVLWTSLGLVVALFFTIYLMMFMPLEPDTLLFGESARLPADD